MYAINDFHKDLIKHRKLIQGVVSTLQEGNLKDIESNIIKYNDSYLDLINKIKPLEKIYPPTRVIFKWHKRLLKTVERG